MIGVVIVAHGAIGNELVSAVEHILGPQARMMDIAVSPGDDLKAKQNEVADAIRHVSDPVGREGVIICSDLCGGTPSNLARKAMAGEQAVLLAGVNLPMLVTIAKARHRGALQTVAKMAVEAGRKYLDVQTPLNVSARAYVDG